MVNCWKNHPFYLWCEKYIPIYWNSGLSLDENIGQFTCIVNELIKFDKEMLEAYQEVIKEFNNLKNWLLNMDFQKFVNNKLDEMLSDGTLAGIIGTYTGFYINVLFPPNSLSPLKNDGITDNYTNLSNIIEYAKGLKEKVIFIFPSGNYLFSQQITFDLSCSIIGVNSKIIMNNENQVCWWLNGENILLKGFHFSTQANCLYISLSKYVEITNCIFETLAEIQGKYQYGITISHSSYINLHDCIINTPLPSGELTYMNNDAIHINGGSSFITIENISGHSGDDFIALNAAEPSTNPGTISNISIKNVNMMYNGSSARGVRFYGVGQSQSISNITFDNCNFSNTKVYEPFVCTNSPSLDGSSTVEKVFVNNIIISNCNFQSSVGNIRFSYATCNDIQINNPTSSNNTYIVAMRNSNVANIEIYNIVNNGIVNVDKESSLSRLYVEKGIFNDGIFMINNTSFINTVKLFNGEINNSYLTTNTSTGNINFFHMDDYVLKNITNNVIMYCTTTIVTLTNIYVEFDGYVISFPNNCELLIANNISLPSNKTNINSVLNVTGLKRCKGMLTIAKDLNGVEGDYYLFNDSGTIKYRIFTNGAWHVVNWT